jgi:hypothetical protein
MPSIQVQVSFTDPFGTLVWTDITRWVRKFSVKRGRQHELGHVEVGTASFTLSNQDGRFSPFNTNSPYNGQLIPMRPIKVTATWSSVNYNVYYGYVESWVPRYGSNLSDVDLTASDLQKGLSLAQFGDTYFFQCETDGAVDFLALNDPVGTTSFQNQGQSTIASFGAGTNGSSTFAAGSPGPFAIANDTSVAFDITQDSQYSQGSMAVASSMVGKTSITIELWMKSLYPNGSGFDGTGFNDSWGPNLGYNIDTGYAEILSGGGSVISTTLVCDGNWHHLVGVFTTGNGATQRLYVDGVQAATYTNGTAQSALASGPNWTFGMTSTGNVTPGVPLSVANVATYPTALSAATILNHYNIGVTGLLSESSGSRFDKAAAAAGIPASLRSSSTGMSTIQKAAVNSLGTQKVQQYLQTLTDTEFGLMFVDESGVLQFKDRRYLVTNAHSSASQATFADDTAGGHLHYLVGSLVPAEDDLDLWNDVQVQRQGGITQRAQDTTSRTHYGPRSLTGQTGLLQVIDDECLARALFLLARYKAPLQRVRSIALGNLTGAGENLPQMLGRALFDRITVIRQPLDGSASAFSQDSIIEHIAHDVTPDTWTTTWQLSATDAESLASYMVYDAGTTGFYDSGYVYGY